MPALGALACAPAPAAEPAATELSLRLVGNAGVVLSDGTTSLLVDLPYESGAFGYMHYDAAALRPTGTTVSVITHHHRDHFAGDTVDPAAVPAEPRLDILFITPWLNCSLQDRAAGHVRTVLYHRQPDGSDRVCGSAEVHRQGTELRLTARTS